MANFFPLVANYSANIANGFVGNRIEELQSGSNLDFTGSGIVNLAVGNLSITGGTVGQVLSTDGNGVLSWANGGSGGGVGGANPIIEINVPVSANNQSFTNPNISAFLNNTYAAVYVNGVLQPTTSYIISGTTLTINTFLNNTDKIAIGPTGGAGSGSGTVTSVDANTVTLSNTAASSLGFSLTGGPIISTGTVTLNVPSVSDLRTNANIGNVANLNLNGNVSTFLNGTGTWTTTPISAAGANTQVQYNLNGNFAGSANFTFNGNNVSTTNVFEKVENLAAATVINLANAAYFTKTLSGPTTFTVIGAPATPQVGSFVLHVSNAAAGATFNFGTDVKWAGGTVPTLSSNAVTTDILGFYSIDSGTTWYGFYMGKDVA